jgi:sigma-B regulation protein RsbU (phosphoserine phosphatase)
LTSGFRLPVTIPQKKIWPTTYAGWAMLAGVVVWFLNWVFSRGQTLWGSSWLKSLVDLVSVAALIPLAYWVYRGTRWVLQRLLWRLRRRLVVTWLLIGVLPVLLLAVLITLLGLVLLTQTNVSLARRQLELYLAESRAAARALSQEVQANATNAGTLVQTRTEILTPIFPQVRLGVRSPNGLPDWLAAQTEFHGLIVELTANGRREVSAYHYIQLNPKERTALHMKYPLSGLCNALSGTVGVPVSPGYVLMPLLRAGLEPAENLQLRNFTERDYEGIWVDAPVHDWATGQRMEGEVLRLDDAFLRPRQIWQRVDQFRTGSQFGYVVFWVLVPVMLIFGLIAGLALTSAIVLTRTITGTVHYLYEGTRRVEAGDFEHEIRAVSRDQLGELVHSFNRMIRSVRDLLQVSAEKQRLDQEMKIAAQVQSRLFPRNLPPTALLDFAPGVCLPARQVSGDYYDFLAVAPGLTGIVIADVCGKGVSAALLMANLQAILRSQVQACAETSPPLRSVAEIVAQVNQRLTEVAPDASFVTLCYAEFDEQSSTLRYTNAGHNPPLVWRAPLAEPVDENLAELLDAEPAEFERLECGGTVVGLFADAAYEQAAVRLYSGDFFVAFTDGLLEAHNAAGEEFGEARIREILKQHAAASAEVVKHALLFAVQTWTNGIEQEDDLTLVVFKRR